MPSELRGAFGTFTACVFDGWSGEPVGWAFKLLRKISYAHWSEAKTYGELVCVGGEPHSWVLVTKWITPAEAIEKHGDVTDIERGPRGGFRSVVYGDTPFFNKRPDPQKEPPPRSSEKTNADERVSAR